MVILQQFCLQSCAYWSGSPGRGGGRALRLPSPAITRPYNAGSTSSVAAQLEHQVDGGLRLHATLLQGAVVLQLCPAKDQALRVLWYPLLLLNQHLQRPHGGVVSGKAGGQDPGVLVLCMLEADSANHSTAAPGCAADRRHQACTLRTSTFQCGRTISVKVSPSSLFM